MCYNIIQRFNTSYCSRLVNRKRRKYCRLFKASPSLQLQVKNCEMSADKFNMLFMLMFIFAGIFQLINVRWVVLLLLTLYYSRAMSHKRWFYTRFVFILPCSQGEIGWVQRPEGGLPLPTDMPNLNQNNIDTNLNQNNIDKYLFMTLKSLQMTVIDCNQETILHNHKILHLNKRKIHTSSCFTTSCIQH